MQLRNTEYRLVGRWPVRLTHASGRSLDAERGLLMVPSCRQQDESQAIALPFVRVPARRDHGLAPLVVLAGGPGAPAIGSFEAGFFEHVERFSDDLRRGHLRPARREQCTAEPRQPGAAALRPRHRANPRGVPQCATRERPPIGDVLARTRRRSKRLQHRRERPRRQRPAPGAGCAHGQPARCELRLPPRPDCPQAARRARRPGDPVHRRGTRRHAQAARQHRPALPPLGRAGADGPQPQG